jgi:hypothetical protein
MTDIVKRLAAKKGTVDIKEEGLDAPGINVPLLNWYCETGYYQRIQRRACVRRG